MRIVTAFHESCSCKKVTPIRKLHVDRTMFCFRCAHCICMVTKTKNRFLTMYNKQIPSLWFGLHLLIVSVCMFVVLFNRSLRPVAPIFAWMINQITNPRLGCKVKRITTVNINWCLGEELLRIASFT